MFQPMTAWSEDRDDLQFNAFGTVEGLIAVFHRTDACAPLDMSGASGYELPDEPGVEDGSQGAE